MKTTRNSFVLLGNPSNVRIVLNRLKFKGVVVISTPTPSTEDIFNAFIKNKSIVISSIYSDLLPADSKKVFIKVTSTNLSNDENCISLSSGNIEEQFSKIALSTNCDIGDALKNCSGLNGKPTVSDCCYCKFLKNGYSNCYGQKIIYTSKHFFVMPTLGQFCNGYLLIIPFQHVMSMAEFSIEQIEDFKKVLFDIKELLSLTYHTSNFLVWENGTGDNGCGKASNSIVHAHIHIAPSKLTATEIKNLSRFPFLSATYGEIQKHKKFSYLSILHNDENWKICDSNSLYIPRQYVRQILAEEYNLPDFWNWREFGFQEKMFETNQQIRSALLNAGALSPRLVQNTFKFLYSQY